MLERNKIMSTCQDDAFWYITRSYERSCWELEKNKNELPFWPPRSCIFRIACRYLLHSLIFPHSLCVFKDFGMQIMSAAVFTKIFIFQKWVLFCIWDPVSIQNFRTEFSMGSLSRHYCRSLPCYWWSLQRHRQSLWCHRQSLWCHRQSLWQLAVAAAAIPIIARLTKHRKTLWNKRKTSWNICETSRNM